MEAYSVERDKVHRAIRTALRAACATVAMAAAASTASAQSAAQYARADIQYGSRIYAAQCNVCHGPTGDTIAGVDLASGKLRRASTDAELRGILTSGIAGTAMAAFKFDASELTMIVAYVRNMKDFNAAAVPLGDAGRGHDIFVGQGGCANCHRVYGKGPRVAPDLSDIGSTRSADALQRSLVDPNGSIIPANRSVRAVTRDGRTVNGRRLNEDTYTVQLIDDRERLVSLIKADLKDYRVVMESSMASYRDKLAPQELADVVAYLLSLKGLK
jgi:putative heme-binding domain-containing protein